MTCHEVALGTVIRQRKSFITIDDDATYKRCRVQTSARGVVLRDVVPGAEIKTKKQQVCRAGDFLVAEIDAKAGGYGLVPAALEGAVVSSHYFLFEVDGAQLDRDYLGWYARTDRFFDQVRAVGSTNYAAIRPSSVLQYTMPLPPLPDQHRIVARLNAAVAGIERVKFLHSSINEDLLALITRANAAYQAQPVRLADALALDEDRVAVTSDANFPQVGIRGFGGGLFRKGGVTAAETTYRHFNRLATGQFVVSQVKGWEGAVAVCDPEFAGLFASPEYRTFRCNPTVLSPAYFAYLSRTQWFHAKLAPATRGQGARRERLRPEMLLAISIPLPPVEVQDQLVPLFDRVAVASSGAGDLGHLLPAILNEAFGTGAGA
jgi:type I restriction enzyme S subunit